MQRFIFTLTVATLWLAVPAKAQTIFGTAYDGESERTIANVAVVLLNSDREIQASTLTDASGDFELAVAAGVESHLRVQALGYAALQTTSFVLAEADSLGLDLTLAPAPVALDPIVATVFRSENREGFERRSKLSYGTHIGPEEFAALEDERLNEFVRERTPFLLTDSFDGIRFFDRQTLRCNPMLFVDGRRALHNRIDEIVVDLDRWIDREAIRAVELYRPRDPLPSPFFGLARTENRGVHPPCGVLVIWTVEAFE